MTMVCLRGLYWAHMSYIMLERGSASEASSASVVGESVLAVEQCFACACCLFAGGPCVLTYLRKVVYSAVRANTEVLNERRMAALF